MADGLKGKLTGKLEQRVGQNLFQRNPGPLGDLAVKSLGGGVKGDGDAGHGRFLPGDSFQKYLILCPAGGRGACGKGGILRKKYAAGGEKG